MFDSELDILHIFVMDLKGLDNLKELFVGFCEVLTQGGNLLSIADTSNHILALSVQQVITIQNPLTRGWIAGEGNTCTRIPAHVPEDHGHDIDSRTQIIRNVGSAAIINSTLSVPGFENGFGS